MQADGLWSDQFRVSWNSIKKNVILRANNMNLFGHIFLLKHSLGIKVLISMFIYVFQNKMQV